MATTISGPIVDALNLSGFAVSKVWGATGTISGKRASRWNDVMNRCNRKLELHSKQIIARCVLANGDVSWLPFPDAAPRWFVESSGSVEGWRQFYTNANEASNRAAEIVGKFSISKGISVAAEVTLGGSSPYIDFYFAIPATAVEEFRCVSTWVNQNKLFNLVLLIYPCARAEYSPDWLAPLSLDVYIPTINTAIEYNGAQHYRPVEFFGGIKSFADVQERDQRKAELCKRNGVNLIIWPYWECVTEWGLTNKLKDAPQSGFLIT